MSCVFCAVIDGTAPAAIVQRDDVAVALLDRRPVFPGHVLVVPAVHVETLTDLPLDQIGPLFERVQRLACAVERALGADGTWVSMNNRVSQSVPHLHIHVVPRSRKDGLRGFYWPRQHYLDDSEMAIYATRIADALS